MPGKDNEMREVQEKAGLGCMQGEMVETEYYYWRVRVF